MDGRVGTDEFEELPESIRRLTTNLNPQTYDLSGMGQGTDVNKNETYKQDDNDDSCGEDNRQSASLSGESVRVVKKLGLEYFCKNLVEHFDILWRKNEKNG